MTLQQTTVDYFFSWLLSSYLRLTHEQWMALKDLTPTAETAALDLPSGLSIKAMDGGTVPPRPGIIVAVREEQDNTNARRRLMASCILSTWLKSDVEGAAEVNGVQTTRPEAAAIQIAMEKRLRDLPAFNAYLASLSTATLTGWSIMGRPAVSNSPSGRDGHLQTIDYATLVRLTVALSVPES